MLTILCTSDTRVKIAYSHKINQLMTLEKYAILYTYVIQAEKAQLYFFSV